jgi:hypothetical protein
MESRYWKEMLRVTARELVRRKKPKPLTERRCEIIERDVILCFFVIRRLVELYRVSRLTVDFKFNVFSCPFNGRNMSLLDRHRIEKSYHLENEISVSKKMLYIANQFIHSSLFLIVTDQTRNWDSFYVVSDYDKKQCIWRISVHQIAEAFKVAAEDYLEGFSYKYDKKNDEYRIVPD